jgi:hypothetical protein
MAHGLASSLRRARREPSAFGGFYMAQSRELLAFFVRRTFDFEVARDLTAETFAQAFEHRRRFRGSTDAEASGWLYALDFDYPGRPERYELFFDAETSQPLAFTEKLREPQDWIEGLLLEYHVLVESGHVTAVESRP